MVLFDQRYEKTRRHENRALSNRLIYSSLPKKQDLFFNAL